MTCLWDTGTPRRTDGVIIMSLVTLVLDDTLLDPPAALAVSAMASARRESGAGLLGTTSSSGGAGSSSMRLGADAGSSLPSQVGLWTTGTHSDTTTGACAHGAKLYCFVAAANGGRSWHLKQGPVLLIWRYTPVVAFHTSPCPCLLLCAPPPPLGPLPRLQVMLVPEQLIQALGERLREAAARTNAVKKEAGFQVCGDGACVHGLRGLGVTAEWGRAWLECGRRQCEQPGTAVCMLPCLSWPNCMVCLLTGLGHVCMLWE